MVFVNSQINSSLMFVQKTLYQQSNQEDFDSTLQSLKKTRQENMHDGFEKPSVMILGGGPAGLIHALESVIQGNTTLVIEKRTQINGGRENAVALKKETVNILKRYGIYQYLLTNSLIYPGEEPNVRLKDLEEAIKFVLREISGQEIILYDSQVIEVIQETDKKIDIRVESRHGERTRFSNIDILLNTEGAHSHTHENLLHFEREVLLPAVPVIAAICKDNRPEISGSSSLINYGVKTFINTLRNVYFHVRFLMDNLPHARKLYQNTIEQSTRGITSPFPGPIKGAVALSTPGQCYVGVGLSLEESNKLEDLSKRVEEAKLALNKKENGKSDLELMEDLDKAKADLNTYLEYWTRYSICWVNAMEIIKFIVMKKKPEFNFGMDINKVNVAYIGVDRIKQSAAMHLNKSLYLVAGDTYATTDATTGRGCNTAIEAVDTFKNVLNLKSGVSEQLLVKYSLDHQRNRDRNSLESLELRELFRPDTISKVAIYKINCGIQPSQVISEDEMIILEQWSKEDTIDESGVEAAKKACLRISYQVNEQIKRNNCCETPETDAAMKCLNYLKSVVSQLEEKLRKKNAYNRPSHENYSQVVNN